MYLGRVGDESDYGHPYMQPTILPLRMARTKYLIMLLGTL